MLHTTTAQNVLKVKNHLRNAIDQNAIKAIINSQPASQSSQSVILTACEVEVIININRGIYHIPISLSHKKGIYIDVYHNLK